ncbi:MAG TPA: DUF1549 domain-containing protein [Planctomycetota bacterium]|nr:DUF1549 domain-containing protein [Planctomycetota bacterium]
MLARTCLRLFAALTTAAPLLAQAPAPTPAPTLQLLPERVQLDSGRDQQRVLLLLHLPSGACEDHTADASWSLQTQDLAELDTQGGSVVLRPRRDGDTVLLARLGDLEARAPVSVQHSGTRPPISFTNDVLPILTRSGCNAGSCHGAAVGKNGFALSLFGYDPAHDHTALTRELRGRRIDPAEPEHSLFLLKATQQVAHKGGKRFATDAALHALLREWIAAGAAADPAPVALTGIDVLPAAAVLVGQGRTLPLLLRARSKDGSDADVTALALWSSSNDTIASVAGDGKVTANGTGEAYVMARYGGFAVVAQLRVRLDDAPFTWPEVPANNFVDQLIYQKLRDARVLPAAVCSDAVFVRRVHLDLLGLLPTPAATTAFLADPAPDKRARLIDDLLERPEFAAAQAMAWAEVLQVDQTTMEQKGAALLQHWLQDGFAAHRPFDAMVRDLLTANGSSFANAEVNFWLTAPAPNLLGEKVVQNFLGVRLQCAQCHNHPFENWAMDDYYGFAAFFAQIGKKRSEDPDDQVVFDRQNGEVQHKRTGAVMAPRFLGGAVATIPPGTDRRTVLAQWLTAPDNRWFAANVANRVWARLLGRGIVDPPDDVRVSNPPSHPQLLQQLAALLVEHQFDVRVLFRAICNSRTWQLGPHPDAPPMLFAGNLVRRLAAEQLLDAIGAVTAVPTKYPGVPLGGPASAIAAGRTGVRFLDVFGRPTRDSACTCDRRAEPTLGQTLHLINGETISKKISEGGGRLQHALKDKQEPAAMLDDLFLAAYSRAPTDGERDRLLAQVTTATDAAAAWQDIYWAVLNSKEFSFQH